MFTPKRRFSTLSAAGQPQPPYAVNSAAQSQAEHSTVASELTPNHTTALSLIVAAQDVGSAHAACPDTGPYRLVESCIHFRQQQTAMHKHDHGQDTHPDDASGDDTLKSKSQLKREAHALQALGEALLDYPAATLREAGIADDLCDAIAAAQGIRQHSARKRQRQYIGKLMRKLDPEPIQAILDRLTAPDKAETAALHRLEHWRDRLIAEGDPAVSALLDTDPHLDRQHLRRLVRDARSERQKQIQPARHARALFRYLRDTAQV